MIELRPQLKKDDLFIEAVYGCTRETEMNLTNWTAEQKNAFVLMQSMAQQADYKVKYPGTAFQIIMFKNKNAGRFYTWENDTEIRLIDITVLPQFRGKGIATFIISNLIKKSGKQQKKISLHVDPVNPALNLYLRLGFIKITQTGRHYYMERNPL